MKKKIILTILFFCSLSSAFAQPGYWQQQVNYKIDVTLNDVDNTLDGFVKMDYYNNSPDTLHFIWILLWPNAFKNDRTAFSDQLLENGRTDFYFSDDDKKGYINRLDFRVDNIIAKTEDHPQHQDIIKLILPQPLTPNNHIKIETPFHIKLPYNFTGNGHQGHSYQITQWYPKPAVYDSKGWHDIPYLTQGGYNEFGNYKVIITLPGKYTVAAPGIMQDSLQGSKLLLKTKTLYFEQNNSTDFVWFADKNFLIKHDTIQSSSGKIIDAFIYYTSANASKWKNGMQFIRNAINTKTNLLGDYPFNTISIAENTCKHNEAMAFPAIALLKPSGNEPTLDFLITHLTGYNWFGGALANNERDYPWMNKGMNAYYDNKYLDERKETILQIMDIKKDWLKKRLPDDPLKLLYQTFADIKKDQPIETTADSFSLYNYYLIAFVKSAEWMKLLQGNYMKAYYKQWQFKHPYPDDFKNVVKASNTNNTDSVFSLLNKKGSITDAHFKKDIRFSFLFNLKQTDKHNYISLAPAIGYNNYDGFMIGALIHNYQLPLPKFQFALAPLYATSSQQLNGIGKLSYSWYPDNRLQKIVAGVNGSRFSIDQSLDTNGNKIFENFYKVVPSLQFYFKHDVRSNKISWLDIRSYIIGEKTFNQSYYTVIPGSDSSVLYPTVDTQTVRYINQVSFNFVNNRVLYPYDYQFKLQQGKGFYRFDVTGNYFFNYINGGGMKVRLFASKFGFVGQGDYTTSLYEPKLLAATGTDDYAYNDYFIGRTASSGNAGAVANQGLAAQQVMIQQTGGLKLRVDQFTYLEGQSSNWVAALNFNTSLPNGLFPVKLPISIFFDVGTYAEAWDDNSPTSRFLYTGGLQLSLLKNTINIYLPIIYSSDFTGVYTTDAGQSSFWKKITFSIDIQNIKLKDLVPQLSL